ncbi:PKD domain-containing protein [Nocardioides caeni]|uniref:PKD domain-containing protein n=1 Tax=Nocardioides caeni TaxID=574700 RepID=A0A4S8NH06_9ACTN|nr:PKD domain-containing protein [Nocardioides caeni]THV15928.1 PKD domain-containing protein [Nocardioides caeni]
MDPAIYLGTFGCSASEAIAVAEAAVYFCAGGTAEPVLTLGAVRTAFARLDLPAGTLVIQPPDGLTLVNFDTNFYTTSTEPLTRTVTLLGRQVTLEATPATYTWDFGDGKSLATSDPGAPYPALRVTHSYGLKGTYRPSLSTTYAGRFRVGGGAWRQIPGTVTIDGAGQPLRAIEARPTLVGY